MLEKKHWFSLVALVFLVGFFGYYLIYTSTPITKIGTVVSAAKDFTDETKPDEDPIPAKVMVVKSGNVFYHIQKNLGHREELDVFQTGEQVEFSGYPRFWKCSDFGFRGIDLGNSTIRSLSKSESAGK
jgi:hypothetical protein